MANGGTWDATSLPTRPGIYINFQRAALNAISGGARGIVALPVLKYNGGTIKAKEFHTVETVADAIALVGADNAAAITYALQGGAKEVLVYAVPETATFTGDDNNAKIKAQFASVMAAYEMQDFNVFAYPDVVSDIILTDTKAWVVACRDEGKHFMFVAGGNATTDANITQGNERSALLKDEYIVNLVTGVVLADGTTVQSGAFSPFIAGLIAGTAINEAITYKEIPVVDVTLRLKNSEVQTALNAGSLVLIKDGNKVRVEQGITTNSSASGRGKIRTARAKQAVATDIPIAARDNYIGKITNDSNGQATLIAAIKSYLETLEADRVLGNPTVALDPRYKSEGDSAYLAVSYTDYDSMERIFMTITA